VFTKKHGLQDSLRPIVPKGVEHDVVFPDTGAFQFIRNKVVEEEEVTSTSYHRQPDNDGHQRAMYTLEAMDDVIGRDVWTIGCKKAYGAMITKVRLDQYYRYLYYNNK